MTVCLLARAVETVRHLPTVTRAILCLGVALPLLLLPARPALAEAPSFFSVQPGTAGKALVDLTWGEPLARLDVGSYRYAPPEGAPEASEIVAGFFPDLITSRLDVYLKQPMSAADLKSTFGNRVISRERSDGRHEELFYPSLQGIIYKKGAESPVVAISFLSPRYLADIYCERFNELFGAGKYQEAIVEADKAVLVDPDYARGYVAQGLYYESLKNVDEALVRYNAALNARYTPERKARAYTRMGVLYQQKNQLDKAAEAFRKSLELDPRSVPDRVQYALFLISQKKEEQALAELRQAVAIDPANTWPREELARFFSDRKRYDEALPLLKELSEWADSPAAAKSSAFKRSNLHFSYAYDLAATGKRGEAIASYQKAIRIDPTFYSAYNNLGRLYVETGRPQKAEEVLRKGLQVNPGHLQLNVNLVDALIDLNRPEEALRQAEALLALKPGDALSMVQMARARAALWKKKKSPEEKAVAEHWLEQAAKAGYRDDFATDPLLREIVDGNAQLKKRLQQ